MRLDWHSGQMFWLAAGDLPQRSQSSAVFPKLRDLLDFAMRSNSLMSCCSLAFKPGLTYCEDGGLIS